VPAQLLVVGTVRTGDPLRPRASALAVVDGRVAALDDDALSLRGPATEVVELGAGALLPSFGDGHVHPLWGGIELGQAPIRDCTSVDEVVEAVRRYATEHPELPWVQGGSYDPALVPGGLFDARWLDAAVPDRPVVLEASDHHCAWVNTAALRLAGIDAATPDPPAGTIARRPDGEPLGTLVEWTAMDLVRQHLPQPTAVDKQRGLVAAARALAAAGITWAQDAALAPADLPVYLAAEAAGELPLRANVALRAEPDRWPEQVAEFVAARGLAATTGSVRAGTVKLFADGVVEMGTAAMLAPYVDHPDSCGLPVWEPAELARAFTAFDAAGFQVHVHAIGDAGIRAALDAVEAATAANGPRDRRPVIAHVHVVDPADLPRFRALGVIANFEPLWACLEPGMVGLVLHRLGPERIARQYPMGTLDRLGTRLSMGSDWPVSSMVPLEGLAVAVTRQTSAGHPPGGFLPAERLDPVRALAAYSAGVAYQAYEEADWGVLSVGRRADLVALDRDPLATEPLDWPGIAVVGTWLAGVRTHG
jgi:predicted amidohydrolase YtcJ